MRHRADRDESHTHVKRDQTDQKPKSKTPRLVPNPPHFSVSGIYEKTPERWRSNVFRGFFIRASGGS